MVRLVGRPDADGRRDAAGGADRVGRAAVSGRDDGSNADRPQVVDHRLVGLRVARRRILRAAEAHVRRSNVVLRRDSQHALEARHDVGRKCAEAFRGAAATDDAVDFREDLNRHDLRALGDARKRDARRPAVAGGDAGDMCAVKTVAHLTRHGRSRAELLRQAVGADRAP